MMQFFHVSSILQHTSFSVKSFTQNQFYQPFTNAALHLGKKGKIILQMVR